MEWNDGTMSIVLRLEKDWRQYSGGVEVKQEGCSVVSYPNTVTYIPELEQTVLEQKQDTSSLQLL